MSKEVGNRNSGYLGCEDKSRGIKHQMNKSKYKPKSVKDVKYSQQKLKHNLGSNWDRYEKHGDTDGAQLTSSTDFSILASAPIAQGQHFQFKHDKVIAAELDTTPQDVFALDLNMLKLSILTIPFYHRVGIEEKYFTKNQISFMDRNAKSAAVIYNEKYNTNEITSKSIEESCDVTYSEPKKDLVNENEYSNVSDLPTEETKNVKIAGQKDTGKQEMIENSHNDLEQWLDDILDE